MKLAIISHTQHYKRPDGTIEGWGATVTEINHLTTIFEEIYHIAALVETEIPTSSIPYINEKVVFVPINRVGGKNLKDKLDIIWQIPEVISKVNQVFKKVDVFQFRAPTGMGVYLIPYLTFFCSKKGWFKYAGNWKEINPAFGFAFQRWFLKNQRRKVTINGAWNNQHRHCISFENPCLTEEDRVKGKKVIEEKKWDSKKVNFCFVGALNEKKGVDKIIEVLNGIDCKYIDTFYFVGGGNQIQKYKFGLKDVKCTINFTGFLNKDEIIEIYKNCQFIVLPSDNEGFPKVIGEAMNYGCIPIVSDVSCISQYITNMKNGFLIAPNTVDKLTELLEYVINLDHAICKKMILSNYVQVQKFTYQYYNDQLVEKVIYDI
ncbi:glycosyltransferase [Urechidicola vernalis]|uniref:Glycosyltransferase n=1 Tax=Urechidicola vernalis TaxID=3075600 RepID=A0ABU2Y234_9FLAO|nr:glycosyltransferase [Urechidicola sp. P050]MDT0552259.1 glycosyltransferase [Urechidicola sp. P050]